MAVMLGEVVAEVEATARLAAAETQSLRGTVISCLCASHCIHTFACTHSWPHCGIRRSRIPSLVSSPLAGPLRWLACTRVTAPPHDSKTALRHVMHLFTRAGAHPMLPHT